MRWFNRQLAWVIAIMILINSIGVVFNIEGAKGASCTCTSGVDLENEPPFKFYSMYPPMNVWSQANSDAPFGTNVDAISRPNNSNLDRGTISRNIIKSQKYIDYDADLDLNGSHMLVMDTGFEYQYGSSVGSNYSFYGAYRFTRSSGMGIFDTQLKNILPEGWDNLSFTQSFSGALGSNDTSTYSQMESANKILTSSTQGKLSEEGGYSYRVSGVYLEEGKLSSTANHSKKAATTPILLVFKHSKYTGNCSCGSGRCDCWPSFSDYVSGNAGNPGGGDPGGGDPGGNPGGGNIPTTVTANLNVYAKGGMSNYKNFTGNIGGEAYATWGYNRGSDEGDNFDEVPNLFLGIRGLSGYFTETYLGYEGKFHARGQGWLLEDNFDWLDWTYRFDNYAFIGIKYSTDYTNDTDFIMKLDNDGGTFTVDAMTKGKILSLPDELVKVNAASGTVGITNDPPTVNVNLKTTKQNGYDVPVGFYYKGVPVEVKTQYNDNEEDIYGIVMSLYNNTLAKYGLYVAKSSDYDINEYDPTVLTRTNEVVNAKLEASSYSSTVVFPNTGSYKYEASVLDAASDDTLRKEAKSSGTFTVRGEPDPPIAVINSPNVSQVEEEFLVKQSSTDPNGNDSIVEYVWTGPVDVTTEITGVPTPVVDAKTVEWDGKNGGKLVFKEESINHHYRIKLRVRNALGLWSEDEKVIKVLADIPVTIIDINDNNGSNIIKENRTITISVENSLDIKRDPIKWNEAVWTITSLDGKNGNIHSETTMTNGNKQRVLQFSAPGKYEVKVKLSNNYTKANASNPDVAAATANIIIDVKPDEPPNASVTVLSSKPNFVDNPTSYTVVFKVDSASIDGDLIEKPANLEWKFYETNKYEGTFNESMRIPESKITYSSDKTQAYMISDYQSGGHNTIRAVCVVKETFKEPFLPQLLMGNGSHVRSKEAETIEIINWIPKIELEAVQDPKTPYENIDYNGDGVIDGKAIKAYTDDTFRVSTKITDELPQLTNVTFKLEKKDHSGNYSGVTSGGVAYLNYGKVTSVLDKSGGSIRIDEPGIYRLTATVEDDCQDTWKDTIDIRIYTLPKAVLESNEAFRIYGTAAYWRTKENIRFDVRSDPTVVNDEWGKAWHTINWDLDNWEITPLGTQLIEEIHVMNLAYTARQNSSSADKTSYVANKSRLGNIPTNVGGHKFRSISFTEPGEYEIKYWATNYGGKVSVPVAYTIYVEADTPPNIRGELLSKHLRDMSDAQKRASISLSGPYASRIGRQALTVESPDGDYIDSVQFKVTYDSNNNSMFTDSGDTKWLMSIGTGTINGLYYKVVDILGD